MDYMHIFEKCEDGNWRYIAFDRDKETGARSVRDIFEAKSFSAVEEYVPDDEWHLVKFMCAIDHVPQHHRHRVREAHLRDLAKQVAEMKNELKGAWELVTHYENEYNKAVADLLEETLK